MAKVIRKDRGVNSGLLILIAVSFFLIMNGNVGTASGQVFTVPSFDWETLQGLTYTWYESSQQAEVQNWVLYGGPKPMPTGQYNVVEQIGEVWSPNVKYFDTPIEVPNGNKGALKRLRKIEDKHMAEVLGPYFHYDTTNIELATEEATSVPGSTVQLEEGDFYLIKEIAILNFNGTFKGKENGKIGGLTHVHTLPGFAGILFPWLEGNPWSDIFFFYYDENWSGQGSITVSDLTISVDGLTHTYYDFHCGGHFSVGVSYGVVVENLIGYSVNPQRVNTAIERIKAIGDKRSGYGYSCWKTDFAWPVGVQNHAGDTVIKDIITENIGIAVGVYAVRDSDITIENIYDKDTEDYVIVPHAVVLWNLDHCDVNVSNLDTYNSSGIYVSQFWPDLEPNTFVFSHNNIRMPPGTDWAGIELWNEAGEMDVVISNNKIHSPSHIPPFGPIFSFGIDGAEVMNNIITGKGHSAIYVPADYITSKDWIVINNNLSGFHPRGSNYSKGGIPPAHAYFGPETSGFLFIGDGDFKIRVLDLGTDNTITGAIHIQMGKPDNPPGLEMLQKKKEMIENLWK